VAVPIGYEKNICKTYSNSHIVGTGQLSANKKMIGMFWSCNSWCNWNGISDNQFWFVI